jgi:uncharacterized membrane protein YoaK (UPF0700 family)
MGVEWLLPALLSATAGAVDVIGFLALGGLFTAHITGNLVVLAAHYVTGRFSQLAPLLSVPVFVVVLGAVTLVFGAADDVRASRRAMLILHAALLGGCLAFAIALGPLADAGGASTTLVGMLGVAAMATQNALVKLALPGSPSTAVLTTNTTQLAIDLATLARRRGQYDEIAQARHRAGLIFPCVAGFMLGGAVGALLEVHLKLMALAMPVMLAALAVPLGELWPNTPITTIGPRRAHYDVRVEQAR